MSDPNHQAEVHRANVGLLASLGFFSTTMFVVGAVIGSGIFRKPGVMASQIGSPEMLFAVWLIAGVITLFGALVNSEIAAMIPEAGGQYVFFDRMYGSFVAYLYGWAMFSVVKCGAIAGLSFVFAESAGKFLTLPQLSAAASAFTIHLPFIGDLAPLADIGVKGVAALLIITLTTINYLGVKFGSLVQNIFAVAKMTALLSIILLAFLLPQAVPNLPVYVNIAQVFYQIGLAGTITGVVLVHASHGLVLAVWIASAAFASIDSSLEEAARNIGASAWTCFRTVTLPLAAPGLMASAIFVFLESLDEFTGTYFVGVPDITTLPLLMFNASMGGNYQIASITALLLLVPSIGFMLVVERFLKADVLAMVGR